MFTFIDRMLSLSNKLMELAELFSIEIENQFEELFRGAEYEKLLEFKNIVDKAIETIQNECANVNDTFYVECTSCRSCKYKNQCKLYEVINKLTETLSIILDSMYFVIINVSKEKEVKP